ncbi:MAG: DUF4190 domain-containing protein [Bacteroidales bacterium]|nr:DUF4190 domain-containing protein [Bacteroidales bacterium]
MAGQVKTLGILSLVIGIVSLVVFCIPVISGLLAFTGLVLGIIGIVSASKSNEPKGLVIAGTVLSGMGFLIGIAMNLALFNNSNDFFNWDSNFDNNNDFYDPYYYDDFDTNYTDIDSMLLDSNDLENLDPTMNQEDNGPGPAPD